MTPSPTHTPHPQTSLRPGRAGARGTRSLLARSRNLARALALALPLAALVASPTVARAEDVSAVPNGAQDDSGYYSFQWEFEGLPLSKADRVGRIRVTNVGAHRSLPALPSYRAFNHVHNGLINALHDGTNTGPGVLGPLDPGESIELAYDLPGPCDGYLVEIWYPSLDEPATQPVQVCPPQIVIHPDTRDAGILGQTPQRPVTCFACVTPQGPTSGGAGGVSEDFGGGADTSRQPEQPSAPTTEEPPASGGAGGVSEDFGGGADMSRQPEQPAEYPAAANPYPSDDIIDYGTCVCDQAADEPFRAPR